MGHTDPLSRSSTTPFAPSLADGSILQRLAVDAERMPTVSHGLNSTCFQSHVEQKGQVPTCMRVRGKGRKGDDTFKCMINSIYKTLQLIVGQVSTRCVP